MNKKLRFIYFLLFTILALTITTLIIIVYSGYRIDFKYLRLVKTGSLYINTNPEKTDIYLNDKKFQQKTPTIVNQLTPGLYDLKLIKKGYKTWEQKIEINEGLTSFINYDLVLEDIVLSPANEFSQNMFFSEDGKYISYIKRNESDSLNNVYIYDVENKQEFLVYSTEKQIKNIKWSNKNSKLILNIDNKYFVLNISIFPVVNKIEGVSLLSLDNYIKNISEIFLNQKNDYNLLIKDQNKNLYLFNLYENSYKKIAIDFVSDDLVFINNKILYIDSNNNLIQKYTDSDYVEKFDNLSGYDDIKYINDYFVLSINNESILLIKDLKSRDFIKMNGNHLKMDKNYIISWNDYELNVYDIKEKNKKFTTRYSQKILDLNFYLKGYLIVALDQDIKIINIGDNINELNIISNKNNIFKVISMNEKVFVIYRENDKNIISSIELQ